MAAKLELQIKGKQKHFFEPLRGRIVLGNHSSEKDDHYLSSDCATIEEFKEEIDSLKTQLDKLLLRAERHFATKKVKK